MKTMSDKSGDGFSRREFLAGTSMLGAATLLGLPRAAAAEPPPETTRIRLVHVPAVCFAPQYVAEALLRAEGFTDVQYVRLDATTPEPILVSGRADMSMSAVGPVMTHLDRGAPL
jgi:NitT/TauT family transport system substrate-binding protein